MKLVLYSSLVFACLWVAASAEINPRDVTFKFYSRTHPEGVLVHYDEYPDSVRIKKVFASKHPTVILIHGWQDNYEADSNTYVREAILSKLNANIIKVDWSSFSRQGYFAARDAVPSVGRMTAEFLSKISEEFHYPLDQVTLVGFSLGAHIAGNIGKVLRGQIEVIVALDPAGPFISSSDVGFCVHPTDAKYVQAIHTNAGTLGMTDAVGHADFYPNGGSRQPGCGLDLIGGCSHNRAWEFFAESILLNRFYSVKCDSWQDFLRGRCSNGDRRLMGGLTKIDKKARGVYYLQTNDASLYGSG